MTSMFGIKVYVYDYPLLVEEVDLDYYKSRKRRIKQVFKKPSEELQVLIINFAHYEKCGILSHGYKFGRYKMDKAVDTLINGGYIIKILNHYQNPFGKGRARVFQRTPLFETTFKFKLPKRIIVNKSALKPYVIQPSSSQPKAPNASSLHKLAVLNTNLWHCPKNYQTIVNNTTLSMSDGSQVFENIWLFRYQARLFQHGSNNYQQLPSKERKLLRINGDPTVELDYHCLHPNLLLNRLGYPCRQGDIYALILKELGIRKCKSKRDALKLIMLIAININSTKGFYTYLGQVRDKNGNRPIDILNERPKTIFEAIIRALPELKSNIATGKYGLSLQKQDSKIMIDVLESLAQSNVAALPVHDSVIVPLKDKDLAKQTMIDCYKKHTGFVIKVKE